MCEGAIIQDFIPRHIRSRRLTASDLWPDSFAQAPPTEDNMGIRKSPWILEEDKWMLPLVKRTRTTYECPCSKPNWTQMESESFSSIIMGNKVQVQEESGCSLNAKRFPGRTHNEKENHWHNNLEKRLAGKKKKCDLNVNLDNNLECSWPLLTETSEEEDSDEMSDSDSDTYSGPS